jgi:nucleoside-diphosphate-sugar epimerase
MKVTVLGGTRFIGRRVVGDLVARGDEVLVVHRGETEPDDLPECRHLHSSRADFATVASQVREFAPDAVIDMLAMSRSDVDSVLPHLPDAQLVLLSSMDVYEAFWLVLDGNREGEPVPLNEQSRTREIRYPYAKSGERPSDYDKLDVEPSYVERGATVLRLAMIYGEHDRQRREEFILRRVRAGRTRIPVGAGDWLWSRAYVGDVSAAILATLGNPAVAGEIINIGEPAVRSMRGWATEILAAAGHEAELVTVPDAAVPDDLWITRTWHQHVVFDGYKAGRLLGWRPDPAAGLARSVAWHLANPPTDAAEGADGPADLNADFSADDAALAAATEAPPEVA